ncbi:MAG: hypothetical protein A2Y88_13115 [Chloroflexi bacterium RBG_13_48_10]|nr:MAG: hypothetical protein A2Y88_13115 [Chloroflexi bacterium RBG_13_48_10]
MKNYQAFDYRIVFATCGWQKGDTVLVTSQPAPSRPETECLYIALNHPRVRTPLGVQKSGYHRWISENIEEFLAGLCFEQGGKLEEISIDFYFI